MFCQKKTTPRSESQPAPMAQRCAAVAKGQTQGKQSAARRAEQTCEPRSIAAADLAKG
ncbi:hypothetical protein SapgrDRAFT_2798 [Saprospira grandis DSM 2844]|uniref:Uncharacterized protein n=1 Tax=Saprospira grandis DSM 2844 TaxID=694433 RepID=J1I7P6_9BACT|nr:hypothetical protein SapgrDRAFT_2798 [Saprospira grandis DSM 2844]